MANRRTWVLVALLLSAALGIRLAAAAWWQSRLESPRAFAFGDSDSYWALGQTIVRGEPYQYRGEDAKIMRMPGYPLVLAALFALVGDDPPVFWARAENALLGALAVGGVMWLTREVFEPGDAWIAGTLTALYPGAIAASIFVLSEGPFCPLMLLQLICWIKAGRDDATWRARTGWSIAAGLAAGAAVMMRPGWLPFTPFAAVAVWSVARGQRTRQAVIAGWMLAMIVVVMAPWWWRSHRITGRFVVTTLEMGASLYDGWNMGATGASDMSFRSEFIEQQKTEDALADSPPRGYFADRLDLRMRMAALAWAKENPEQVVQLAIVKFARLWNPWPNNQQIGGGGRMGWVIAAGYAPLVLCGLAGAVVFASRGWPTMLLIAPAAYVTLTHMVFVSSIRYRQPPMMVLICLAAALLGCAWRRRRVSVAPQ